MAERSAIPLQALIQHTAILGKTGSGKTSTAKLAVEQVVATGMRVCVLDPVKSDWWGLTSSADGKRAGLPFHILGGPHGHVPLPSSAGKAIGELVASAALPLSIIDMADFEPGGLQRFFVDFAPALLRGMHGVVYLVIEEAHEFAPKERSGIGVENMAIHWAKKLATAGRSKGIRLIIATQRTQALHNAVLGSCETMIVHRLTAPADQEPVKRWLAANATKDQSRAVAESLSSLKTGTGWICSGEAGIFERREFPRITTFDNSATPTGDGGRRQVTTAAVDQDRLRTIIGAAVQEAEANDPKKLKAEIARLERELRRAQALPSGDASAATESQRRIAELEQLLTEAVGENHTLHVELGQMADHLANLAATIRDKPKPLALPEAKPRGEGIPKWVKNKLAPPAPSPVRERAPIPSGTTAPQARILSALAFWKSIGHSAPTREQIAAVAGYKPGSGNFGNLIGGLRSAGLLEIPHPGSASLALGAPYEPLTTAEAAAMMRDVLNAPQLKLVDAMLVIGVASAVTREELAAATEYSAGSGNFGNLIGSLCALGIFLKPRPGTVAIAAWACTVLGGKES